MKKKAVIISMALSIFISYSVIAQSANSNIEEKIKKIEVTGSSEMQIVPDEIFVNVTLQEYYNKQKSKIDINEIQKEFLQKCMNAGISKDRIQIQSMNGYDQSSWYWRRRKKEQPDLLASTTYVIKFSKVSDIDKLVNDLDDNATQNMQIVKTSHSRIEEFRKEVKIKALQSAKTKAQYLCESIGEKIGSAIFIHEIENGPENNYPMYKTMLSNNMMEGDSNQGANEGIDFQKITIRYVVEAQFAIQ